MANTLSYRMVSLITLLLMVSFQAFSTEIKPSQQHSEIEIRAWLGNEHAQDKPLTVAQKQQVVMVIEIATPRWFTSGTDIQLPELNNAIIMQRSQSSTNLTERRDGHTWAKQRWEITIYPTESGNVVIPPTRVGVAFSSKEGGSKYATLYTPPLSFVSHLPNAELTQNRAWFSASSATADQDWVYTYQQSENKRLKVGDSVTRTVTLEAQNSLSILLPQILPMHSTTEFQRYSEPNRLDDTQIRGRYRSSRSEQQTYLLQTGGTVILPSYTITWWNTELQTLEQIIVPGETLNVSHTVSSFLSQYGPTIVSIVAFMMILLGLIYWVIRYFQTHPLPARVQYELALRHRAFGTMRTLVYRQARIHSKSVSLNQLSDDENWLQQAHDFQTGEVEPKRARKVWAKAVSKLKKQSKQPLLPKALPALATHNRKLS